MAFQRICGGLFLRGLPGDFELGQGTEELGVCLFDLAIGDGSDALLNVVYLHAGRELAGRGLSQESKNLFVTWPTETTAKLFRQDRRHQTFRGGSFRPTFPL